ncbi:MAG: ABC transporter ATP-binding protein, partial [Actinobacteria bacterium]|nr:ABC transporter ATP-binding protein [Actinomycetota bacterium]
MIDVERLSYTYPRSAGRAIDDVTLTIDDGDFVLIAGDSGGGKSTLVRAMIGLVPHFYGGAFDGRVRVAGRDTRTNHPRDLADVVGFVAQDPESQSVVDRVEDEIVFAMENLGADPPIMRKRLEETLDAIGLTSLRSRRLDTLSGGERQRVAIASVLAAQPKCLILDEPTSQLDPQSAEEVLSLLQRLNADLGLAIVLVEHRLERVVQYAHRMIVMREGTVVDDGVPRDVLQRGTVATPLSRVARALSWEPLPLTLREGRTFARTINTRIPHRADIAPTGDVFIDVKDAGVTRGGNEVLKRVTFAARAGETVALVGRNGSGKTTLLRTLVGLLKPHRGRRTIAGMDPSKASVEAIAK